MFSARILGHHIRNTKNIGGGHPGSNDECSSSHGSVDYIFFILLTEGYIRKMSFSLADLLINCHHILVFWCHTITFIIIRFHKHS